EVSDVLPESFDHATFEFYGHVLAGVPVQRERWRRAVANLTGSPLSSALSEQLGRLWVEQHFAPQAQQAARELVENRGAAGASRLAKLTWMSDETREAARRKLDTLQVKIGYPDAWSRAPGPEIRAGDAYGNAKRELADAHVREMARLALPADRGDW